MVRTSKLAAVVLTLWFLVSGSAAFASDTSSSAEGAELMDLDAWHAARPELAPDEPDNAGPAYSLGIYPGVSGVVGLPNGASFTADVFISFSKLHDFSVFAGYGVERGFRADANIFTLGWGGVHAAPSAKRQNSFYGTFLRYRRWDMEDHGRHHGLSVGTESGVGWLGLGFELGAARSQRNHWIVTAQVNFRVGLPLLVEWGGGE